MVKIASKGESSLYVGIDIAAYKADVYLSSEFHIKERAFQITQNEEGFKALLARLSATHVRPSACRVLLEATGNYWIDLATKLDEAGYLIRVVNPRRAHQFMGSLTSRGKSDTIDAKSLALMAEQQQFDLWKPPPLIYYELRDQLTRRDDIVCRITEVKNQRHAYKAKKTTSVAIFKSIAGELKALEFEKKTLEKELEHLTKKEAGWEETFNLLRTIKGIGLITACWLLVVTNNFQGCENVEQLINYIGLAPLPYESGKSVKGRGRLNKQSNGKMRKVLYMAALRATTCNEVVKVYYKRLVNESHKPKKVAVCAAMRKLILIAWSVVHNKVAFYVPEGLGN